MKQSRLSEINNRSSVENPVTKIKTLFPDCAVIKSEYVTYFTLRKWLDLVWKNAVEQFSEEFANITTPDYRINILPIELRNIQANFERYNNDGTYDSNSAKYIQIRSEIETDRALNENFPYKEYPGYYNQRNMTSLQTLILQKMTQPKDKSRGNYKLISGNTFIQADSRFINVLKGLRPDGTEVRNRNVKEGVDVEAVIEQKKAEYKTDGLYLEPLINLEVSYKPYFLLDFPRILSKMIGDINTLPSTDYIVRTLDDLLNVVDNALQAEVIDGPIGEVVVFGGGNLKGADARVYLAVANFWQNVRSPYPEISENSKIKLPRDRVDLYRQFMNCVYAQVVNLRHNENFGRTITGGNRSNIDKIIRSFFADETHATETFRNFAFTYDLSEKYLKRFNEILNDIEKNREPIESYEFRTETSEENNLANQYLLNVVKRVLGNKTGNEQVELPMPPNGYTVSFPKLLSSINKILAENYTDRSPVFVLLKQNLLALDKKIMNNKLQFNNEIDELCGQSVRVNALQRFPTIHFDEHATPIEYYWMQVMIYRTSQNIQTALKSKDQIISEVCLENGEQQIDFSDLTERIISDNLENDTIATKILNKINQLDGVAYMKIRKSLEFINSIKQTEITPVVNNFEIEIKQSLGTNMKFILTGKYLFDEKGKQFSVNNTLSGDQMLDATGDKKIDGKDKEILGDHTNMRLSGTSKVISAFKRLIDPFLSKEQSSQITYTINVETRLKTRGPRLTRRETDDISGIVVSHFVICASTPSPTETHKISKFRTIFFSNEPEVILRAFASEFGSLEIDKIPNEYIITWDKDQDQRDILSGSDGANTLELYEKSHACNYQYPFYDGKFSTDLIGILTKFRSTTTGREIRTISKAVAEFNTDIRGGNAQIDGSNPQSNNFERETREKWQKNSIRGRPNQEEATEEKEMTQDARTMSHHRRIQRSPPRQFRRVDSSQYFRDVVLGSSQPRTIKLRGRIFNEADVRKARESDQRRQTPARLRQQGRRPAQSSQRSQRPPSGQRGQSYSGGRGQSRDFRRSPYRPDSRDGSRGNYGKVVSPAPGDVGSGKNSPYVIYPTSPHEDKRRSVSPAGNRRPPRAPRSASPVRKTDEVTVKIDEQTIEREKQRLAQMTRIMGNQIPVNEADEY